LALTWQPGTCTAAHVTLTLMQGINRIKFWWDLFFKTEKMIRPVIIYCGSLAGKTDQGQVRIVLVIFSIFF
jgi:hypothetical protein